jgi:hypothetical protein
MNRLVLLLLLAGVASAAAPPAPRRSQADVLKLAAMLRVNDPGSTARARALARQHDVEEVHQVFRNRSRGGLGIETALHALRKRPLTRRELARRRDDLKRTAEVVWAVAEVTRFQARTDPAFRRRRGQWLKASDEMRRSALSFLAAVRAGDPKKVYRAADRVTVSCHACHTDYR